MLGTASFYKSTPKIMPKTSRSKRTPTRSESPVVSKKPRRVRHNGDILVEKGHLGSEWTRSRDMPKVVVTKLTTDECGQCIAIDMIDAVSKSSTKRKTGDSKENGMKSSRASTRIRSMQTSAVKKLEEMRIEDEEPALLGNQLSDSLDEDDSDNEARKGKMSAYEKKRLENIEENAKFLASLGISKTKETLPRKGTSVLGLKREKKIYKKVDYGPRRPPSLRIRRMDPEGVALPERPAPEPSAEEIRRERKPSGPFDIKPVNISEEDSEENLAKPLFKSMSSLSKSLKSQKTSTHMKDIDELTQTLQKMTLIPKHVAKVTKDRVMSAALHPSSSKIIICAGDKWGRVGVWDMGSKAGDDGVYLFEPHSRPVNCLQFAPADPTKLFSCSYDGTVRCADFEKGIFDEIHTTDVDEDIHCSHFDFLSPDGKKLLVSQNQQQGCVQIVDSRLECKTSTPGFCLHKRYVKTVHVRPTRPEYFVTASNDSTVALWDLRMLKGHGRCNSLSTVTHGKSVSAAYFSPITGNKVVTTSYDDRIRILQVEENSDLEVERMIRHDNHTGRWLTTFRTVWHPRREDVILVGSMDRPRSIQVFDVRGHLLHSLRDDLLGSVCSINTWHPSLDLIAGANSSGRLHVFV